MLYAALNNKSGEVMGKTAAHHTSQEFVAFLADLVANQLRGKEIHLIADHLSAHKTKRVEQFLAAHPKVHLHYTPAYYCWLNQVEHWFARIERDVIARGVFTSVKNLARKLMRYIRHYNRAPKPIKWTYRDPQSSHQCRYHFSCYRSLVRHDFLSCQSFCERINPSDRRSVVLSEVEASRAANLFSGGVICDSRKHTETTILEGAAQKLKWTALPARKKCKDAHSSWRLRLSKSAE